MLFDDHSPEKFSRADLVNLHMARCLTGIRQNALTVGAERRPLFVASGDWNETFSAMSWPKSKRLFKRLGQTYDDYRPCLYEFGCFGSGF